MTSDPHSHNNTIKKRFAMKRQVTLVVLNQMDSLKLGSRNKISLKVTEISFGLMFFILSLNDF